MIDTTARLALPMLQPGQAQKEMFHNEALALLDLAVAAGVESVGLVVPPARPAAGQAWAVGPAPVGDWTGDWAGQAGAIAGYTGSGWRFVAPPEGMTVWSVADGCAAQWLSGGWVVGEARVRRVLVDGVAVLGPRQPGIADAGGGGTVDVEARAAVAAILAAMRAHGLIRPGV